MKAEVLQSRLWVLPLLLLILQVLRKSFRLLPSSSCLFQTFLRPPPSPTALPIPPLVSQSPIPLPEQENVPPACCANPPMTEDLLVPIEVESNDAEGSGEVEEGTMGRVDEETVPQLWRNNQSRAAGWRVVCASNLVHPHPYAHAKGLGNFLEQRARFLRQLGGHKSSDEGTSSREDCVLPHRVPD